MSLPLTLDAWSRIMQWNPCAFMGVTLAGRCEPIDCEQRNQIIQGIESALGKMNDQIVARKFSLFSANRVLTMRAPYFDLSAFQPYTLHTKEYTGTVNMPLDVTGNLHCDDIASIEVEIDALDTVTCEEFVGAEIVFTDCPCKRLGVEFCSAPILDGVVLTMTTRAYNLLDLGEATPDDALLVLEEVTVKVTTRTPAIPLAYMPANVCGCGDTPDVNCQSACCRHDTVPGCLIETRNGIYDAMNFGVVCRTYKPVKYSIEVTQVGLWQDHWADGLVSLANAIIPAGICSCNAISNQRWEDDQGLGKKWENTYRHAFWNPFGIASPGAQRAWKMIEASMSSTVMVMM